MLWSGYSLPSGIVEPNAKESAKYHAAAACQHHLDAIAVFGGCLRTGTGLEDMIVGNNNNNNNNQKKKKKKTGGGGGNNNQKKQQYMTLGLKLIDFCCDIAGNASGVNKKGRLLESNGNDLEAMTLYENCYRARGNRANALLRFNLGWSLIYCSSEDGGDREKDYERGIELWKEAATSVPDEGSEEAAYNLYKEFQREDPTEARHWLDVAESLGYYE